MPGGRPTEYTEEMLLKSKEYIESCEDEHIQETNRLRVKIPTKEGLAFYLKVSRDSLYEWAKVHPEFSDIMEELSSKQANRLMNNGLAGTYNPTIAKVLLTKHGYREGIDQTTNDKDLPTPILNGLPNNDSNTESQTAP